MPRTARIVLPHTPHHIVQRGHNRQTVFASDEDYKYYLDNLGNFKREFGCRVYAYCFMPNHVHLVVDPGNNSESLALLVKRLAGRQTRYVNKLENRSGSLWEGRYKSSIISIKEYLQACCRYIELNPVRAGMVTDPADYRWSSYRAKVLGQLDSIADFPPFYMTLADTEMERQRAYKDYVLGPVPEEEIMFIRAALQRGQVTGSDLFREEIEKKTGIRISNKKQGRPRKKKEI